MDQHQSFTILVIHFESMPPRQILTNAHSLREHVRRAKTSTT